MYSELRELFFQLYAEWQPKLETKNKNNVLHRNDFNKKKRKHTLINPKPNTITTQGLVQSNLSRAHTWISFDWMPIFRRNSNFTHLAIWRRRCFLVITWPITIEWLDCLPPYHHCCKGWAIHYINDKDEAHILSLFIIRIFNLTILVWWMIQSSQHWFKFYL